MNNMKRNACQKCAFAVRDDNPHCGLRGFTTSFNVEWCSSENDKAPNGYELQEDGYFSWVEKKKEYPKTYEECHDMLDDTNKISVFVICKFAQLLEARNAYWKIAGKEMGLGKPWEPTMETVYCISRNNNVIKCSYRGGKSNIFEFPTKEMRDAFKENFGPDLEICKELL